MSKIIDSDKALRQELRKRDHGLLRFWAACFYHSGMTQDDAIRMALNFVYRRIK